MFKYLLIILSIFLTSCFGSGDINNESALKNYDSGEYTILLPSAWSIISDTSDILPHPAIGKISLAITSTKFIDGFSNNLVILSDDNTTNIDSTAYSYLNYLGSKGEYYDYKLLSKNDIILNDGKQTNVYIFEARYNTKTPRLKFLQTGIICDTKAYLLTIALNNSVKDFDKYEDIIKSFSCK